jgi:hypothetical protein
MDKNMASPEREHEADTEPSPADANTNHYIASGTQRVERHVVKNFKLNVVDV